MRNSNNMKNSIKLTNCRTYHLLLPLLILLQLTTVTLVVASVDDGYNLSNDALKCPCQEARYCQPIQSVDRKEIFGFMTDINPDDYTRFNWTKLTTVCLASDHFDTSDILDLVCYAHERNVRVVFLSDYQDDLTNVFQRSNWIDQNLKYATDHFLDGINVDFEGEVRKDSNESIGLTQLVTETATLFHQTIPGSQVTFDVPYAPFNERNEGVDGRNYDFKRISDAVDFLFVMSYDQASQIFTEDETECFAQANSNFFTAAGGLFAFLDLGVPKDKLVFGQPWYGYDYECIEFTGGEAHKCWIAYRPFRGVKCSDAVGLQRSYADIVENYLYAKNTTLYQDEHSREYTISYYNNCTGFMHLIFFDMPYSYASKYQTVQWLDLRGVGVWHLNHLNYSDVSHVIQLWNTFPSYNHGKWVLNHHDDGDDDHHQDQDTVRQETEENEADHLFQETEGGNHPMDFGIF